MDDPRVEEAKGMLSAVWTVVHGDRPSPVADALFLWVAFAALPDGRVMVGGPYPDAEAGFAAVAAAIDEAEWAVWRAKRRQRP